MKVKYEKVINVEGVGFFKKADNWNGLTRYDKINGDGYILTISEKDGLDGVLSSIFGTDTDMNIILCSPNLTNFFIEKDS